MFTKRDTPSEHCISVPKLTADHCVSVPKVPSEHCVNLTKFNSEHCVSVAKNSTGPSLDVGKNQSWCRDIALDPVSGHFCGPYIDAGKTCPDVSKSLSGVGKHF